MISASKPVEREERREEKENCGRPEDVKVSVKAGREDVASTDQKNFPALKSNTFIVSPVARSRHIVDLGAPLANN